MTGKHLLTVSLLLPLVAMSRVVHADQTAPKKRHWDNELRRSRALALPPVGNDGRTAESCAYQYQGGPKSNLWTCRAQIPTNPMSR
jgi:hypothetical protein